MHSKLKHKQGKEEGLHRPLKSEQDLQLWVIFHEK